MQMLEQHLSILAAVKAAASVTGVAVPWRGADGDGEAGEDGKARDAGVDSRVSAEICAGLVKVVVCTLCFMQSVAVAVRLVRSSARVRGSFVLACVVQDMCIWFVECKASLLGLYFG